MDVEVFSAVSMVSAFEADDDTHDLVRVGKNNNSNKTNNNCMLHCTILMRFDLKNRMKAERGIKFSIAALSKQKLNGPVAKL